MADNQDTVAASKQDAAAASKQDAATTSNQDVAATSNQDHNQPTTATTATSTTAGTSTTAATPVTPVTPVEPARPVEPVKPIEPVEPDRPPSPATSATAVSRAPNSKWYNIDIPWNIKFWLDCHCWSVRARITSPANFLQKFEDGGVRFRMNCIEANDNLRRIVVRKYYPQCDDPKHPTIEDLKIALVRVCQKKSENIEDLYNKFDGHWYWSTEGNPDMDDERITGVWLHGSYVLNPNPPSILKVTAPPVNESEV
ncbi:hypothetical protein GCG54_00004039 [Colletotrichum gloeosporioides]|uniref:Uncharacterized protein n=1 Tax=Colletotrichum gloeosporioides TaxID=474922 RepID=A0A8H4FJV2_COLGL|nr:uncharacterized protein GCG54_00004039 [Colletotrichum gloeosporioides]KAF3804770.1 hypothetical protein GCG54_00004039 [Colletotrichum gloeosporioides]